MVVIGGELMREAEETGQLQQGLSVAEDGTLVEASSFWFYIGALATSYESAVVVATVVTKDETYGTLSTFSLPIVGLMYTESLLCQPRRRSPKDMWRLRLHFASFAVIGEMTWATYEFREGNFGLLISHFARLAGQTLGFHFLLKL